MPLFTWMYSLFVSFRSFSLNRSYFRSFRPFSALVALSSSERSYCTSLYYFLDSYYDFSDYCEYLRIISLLDTSIFPTVGPGTSSKNLFIVYHVSERYTAVSIGIFCFYSSCSSIFLFVIRRLIWNYTNLVFNYDLYFPDNVPFG